MLKIGIIAGGETEAPKDRRGSNKKIWSKTLEISSKKVFLNKLSAQEERLSAIWIENTGSDIVYASDQDKDREKS